MKVLIINSPLFRDKNPLYDEDSLPPIGLGLIATALKEKGVDVLLIDAVAQNMPLTELIQKVVAFEAEVVCTNVFTTNLVLVKELVESIGHRVRFIIGGLSTKTLFSEVFKWNTKNQINIVHGDGELITIDIVFNCIKQEPLHSDIGRRFYTIDSTSKYFVRDISTERLDRAFFQNEPLRNLWGHFEANIVTSRGCIYNCAFCAAARSLNRDFTIREKSTASVISELEYISDCYTGVESIRVLDDLFLKNAETVQKSIDVFNHFDLYWRSMAHVETFKNVTEETLLHLRKSGCHELFIGIESGSPRILKQIHKVHNVEMIKANIVKLFRNGINVKGYFIYGFPGETLADFELTYALANDLKESADYWGVQFRTSVFQFRPYHGTELYHSLETASGSSAFSQVSAVKPNEELSEMVGRLQFNFHSGNYSEAPIDVVHEYIYKTTNLNSVHIFALDGMPKKQHI